MWDSPISVWQLHLSHYAPALASRQTQSHKSDLVALDSFVWHELPPVLSLRTPPHITAAEYAQIVRWKLKRGKWRPRLQNFADSVHNDEVVQASEVAFEALKEGRFKDALNGLVALKGCGPATASAILAAKDPHVPFMADELLLETQGEKKKYTVPAYLELIRAVQAKATELTEADDTRVWTARDIERAVFASCHHTPPPTGAAEASLASIPNGKTVPKPEKAPSRKRRRTAAQPVGDESTTPATQIDDVEVKNSDTDAEVIIRPPRRKFTGESVERSSHERPLRRSARTKTRRSG